MILLLDRENEGNNSPRNVLKRKFGKYEVVQTGLDKDMLKLLIDIYLVPEFQTKKISNEKSEVL